MLQTCVDSQIQKTGFLPEASDGFSAITNHGKSNGLSESWACYPKQRDLILELVQEHPLDKAGIEKLAQGRFGKGAWRLDKLEASGLIDELLERH